MLKNLTLPALGKHKIFNSQFLLCFTLLLISGCSNVELLLRGVDKPAEKQYRYVYVDVRISDATDVSYVVERFAKEFQRRDVRLITSQQNSSSANKDSSDSAWLKIYEIERSTESMVRYRRFGRTSLTINHGREEYDKPVITLRATLVDSQSGSVIFQADYVTQGQWYEDSTRVVASLAGKLIEQLEGEGFIPPQKK